MSEQNLPRSVAGRRRDLGMTIPEVLIAIVITGLIASALASVATLIVKQADNNRGRLNNTRSEQAVGIWMPADLASAELVDTDPAASPCGSSCPAGLLLGGSNALMLTWTGSAAGVTTAVTTTTMVSYRYVQNGDEYEIVRVACVSTAGGAPECTQITVLHDVPAPPPGQDWQPGITSPTWVMLVRLALDPSVVTDELVSGDPTYRTKNGRRVTVTINGGGDTAGAGGGEEVITLSAGGTDRHTDLSTNVLADSPSFSATRSRCGGDFGMLVDTSGSIGSTNMASVRTGIAAFIDAFAGTPVKLQVVRFSSTASTLGAGSGWGRYFDMLVESDVAELKAAVSTLSSSGYTNWEDALFRMLKNSNGTVQDTLPDTLIFFTDGMPTYSRLNGTSGSAAATAHPDDVGLPTSVNGQFQQVSWNRANRIAREFDADVERFIGVFVGTDTTGTSNWLTHGAGYHLANFLRGFHMSYERGYHASNFQRGYHLGYQYAGSGLTYERKQNNQWSSVTRSYYESKNTSPGEADGYRVRVTGTLGSWTSTSQSLYDRSNTTSDSADGFRTTAVYSSPYDLWESTTESAWLAGNTTADATDGWTATVAYSAPYSLWETSTQALYAAGNVDDTESDGWRSTVSYSAPYANWESVSEAAYNAGNTSWGSSDGWDATKVYSTPYTAYEGTVTTSKANTEILSGIVTVGAPVPAAPEGGPYTNAAVADMYVLPNWSQFAGALNSMALAECGGTVTVQTRVGSAAAADPFTYQNSVDLKTATTSSSYRSGTFDFDLSGGGSVSATISPLNLSDLGRYSHVSWSCKSAGADYPFTLSNVAGTSWKSITLNVSPNQAISCIQTVSI